jgi:hypothetical protein
MYKISNLNLFSPHFWLLKTFKITLFQKYIIISLFGEILPMKQMKMGEYRSFIPFTRLFKK